MKLHDISRPKQWKTIASSDLLEAGYPVYGANGRIGYYSEYTHELPTLMITCRGATCGNVHISEPRSYINGNAMAIDDIDSSKIDIKYLYYYFLKRGFSDVISGSAQPQITGQGLTKIEIPLPPLKEQKRIAAILDKADAIRRKRQQAIKLADDFLRSVFLDMFGDPVTNPKGWEVKKIRDFLSIKNGYAFKSEYFVDKGNYVLLTPGNFYEKGGYRDRAGKQKFYDGPVPDSFVLKEGDILLAMTEQAAGLLGASMEVPSGLAHLHNQRLGLLIYDFSAVNSKYLLNLFNSPSIRKAIHANAVGLKVRHTSPSKIEELEIGFPPFDLQEQFSLIVNRTMAAIESMNIGSLKSEINFASLSQKAFSGIL